MWGKGGGGLEKMCLLIPLFVESDKRKTLHGKTLQLEVVAGCAVRQIRAECQETIVRPA
jgi:hypothetical protein